MSKMWERADFWPAERIASPEADEFARGLAEGRRTVESELASEREALLQLAGGLDALKPPSIGILATLIVAAVERLVSDIVGDAPIDPMVLIDRAGALAERIAAETEAVLMAHPDDAVLLDEGRIGLRVLVDAGLPRGTVQARVGDAMIEDGVAAALARLRADIVQMGISL
jgi:flagellar assembly protein FliH